MSDLGALARLLVLSGLVLIAIGGLVWLGQAFPGLRLGRLPGDIRVVRDNFRFYFPITTIVLLSVLVSAALWVVRWLSK
jgi:hypothetical protein